MMIIKLSIFAIAFGLVCLLETRDGLAQGTTTKPGQATSKQQAKPKLEACNTYCNRLFPGEPMKVSQCHASGRCAR